MRHQVSLVVLIFTVHHCTGNHTNKCVSINDPCAPKATEEHETCCLTAKQFGEKKLGRCGLVTQGVVHYSKKMLSTCCLIPHRGDFGMNYCSDSGRPCCEERGEICTAFPRESMHFCCLPKGSKGPCDYNAPEGGCCHGLICDRGQCVRRHHRMGRRKWRDDAEGKELPTLQSFE